MKNIATALVKAKKAFSPALKDKTNPAFRSKYADLGACLEAVNDALLDNGIALYQETSEDMIGVTVETVLLHESGECLRSGKLHVPAVKNDPQGFGSALTYARRYSLMTACGIAPEDDDGNAAVRAKAGHSLEPLLAASIEQAQQRKAGVMGAVLDEIHLAPVVMGRLQKLSEEILAGFDKHGADDAFDYIAKQGLDTDERTYLWSLLPSKVRSSLKAVGESRKPVTNRRDPAPA